MIVLVAQYFGKPGSGDAVRSALERMAAAVRDLEPGCRLYRVSRAVDAPDDWLLYEEYVDQAAFAAHRTTPHFKSIVEDEIGPLLLRRERRVYDLVLA
jgi:autoinducer 2-degrading protein